MAGQGSAEGAGPSNRWWRHERLAARADNLAARGRILSATRQFFTAEGFVEVETPALQVSPGLEPHLQAFATMLNDPRDGAAKPRYLHTSPEFAMKKLLAGGMTRIWQLAHVFRDRERGTTHHPEFAMLEWYRAGATYRDLMDDCEKLLRAAQVSASEPVRTPTLPRGHGGGSPPQAEGGARHGLMAGQGCTADARLPFERLSVAEAFVRYADIDIFATAPDPAAPAPPLATSSVKLQLLMVATALNSTSMAAASPKVGPLAEMARLSLKLLSDTVSVEP